MAKHTGEQFNDQRIVLDGDAYDGCAFTKCVIVYRGGTIGSLTNCSFRDCRFELEDAAQRTLEFMHAVYHGFGDVGMRLVEETFNNIRRPRTAGAAPGGATASTPSQGDGGGPDDTDASKDAPAKPAGNGGKRSK